MEVTAAKYLPTKSSTTKVFLAAFTLVFLYALENLDLSKYLVTLFWMCTIVLIGQIRAMKTNTKLRYRKNIYFWSLYFGIFYIIVHIFGGLIGGLGTSPYNHSALGIISNIILVATPLFARELIRSYIVNNYVKKGNLGVFILLSLLMTATSFSFNRYASLSSFQQLVEFLGGFFLPVFSNNMLASFLVFLGGPFSSIIYLGILEGFHWLSPILPNLKWIGSAFIGVFLPITFMAILNYIHSSYIKALERTKREKENPLGWLLTSIVAIVIIWFAVGVFPIFPSVVATGSMEPEINPADVVLVQKIVDMEGIMELEIDDIIMFRRGDILISHRIIEIIHDNDGIKFRTKGDNNSAIDRELVIPKDVRGIIKHTIPKVGWPTLLLKSDKDIELNEIEF